MAPPVGQLGPLADHATTYSRAGLEIFPVNPHDKTPFVSQYQATTNPDQIRAWWQRWPTALIGHRITADHIILDVDPRHGGLETWKALLAELDQRPITRWHRSGRGDGGGHTWWLRPSDNLTVTKLDHWAQEHGTGHHIDKTDRWTGGIDILHRDHRYTILPPSPHPDTGEPYTWAGSGHTAAVAAMPVLLAELITNDQPPPPPRPIGPADPDSIADQYNTTGSWAELLAQHGWTLRAGTGDDDGSRWRHPRATGAFSATLRHNCLFVYSPNTPFDVTNPGEPHGYTLFRAMALLEHSGDLSEAASTLRQRQTLSSLNSLISPIRSFTNRLYSSQNNTESSTTTTISNNGCGSERDTYGEKSELSEERSPPQLHPNALHGPLGQATQLLDPYTEADPTAVLATLLTAWGALIGRTPHVVAGHTQHPPRLSTVIVGNTAKARKGTSWATARLLLDHIDPLFMTTRVIGGFGSGESVIDEVRDPQPNQDDPDKPGDPGADDKRLLIHEPEFARVLKICARESSVLSTIIRDAWDGSRLQARARTRKSIATGHHITLIGHITAPELARNLNATEIAGGFANRILWIYATRSKRLPFDQDIDNTQLTDLVNELRARTQEARQTSQVRFGTNARDRWAELYDEMADDDPGGLLGAIVARPEPQCLRLALTYALLDGSRQIQQPHIEAAWALWSYSRQSAAYIWGDAIGDEIADALLKAIRRAGPQGLDLTTQSAEFARKVPAKRLAVARNELEARGLIETVQEQTDGRPRTLSRIRPKEPT